MNRAFYSVLTGGDGRKTIIAFGVDDVDVTDRQPAELAWASQLSKEQYHGY